MLALQLAPNLKNNAPHAARPGRAWTCQCASLGSPSWPKRKRLVPPLLPPRRARSGRRGGGGGGGGPTCCHRHPTPRTRPKSQASIKILFPSSAAYMPPETPTCVIRQTRPNAPPFLDPLRRTHSRRSTFFSKEIRLGRETSARFSISWEKTLSVPGSWMSLGRGVAHLRLASASVSLC